MSFESLPNEILAEIFQHISTDELSKLFYGFNTRLNLIIDRLVDLRWILNENWDNDQRVLSKLSSTMKILLVKHDESVDFSNYPSIRILKLMRPTENQCNTLATTRLSQLEQLSISNFYFSDFSENLCRAIFSSKFFNLRRLEIDRLTIDPSFPYFSFSLRELTISPSTWKFNLYPILLNACPNLTVLSLIRVREFAFFISRHFILPHENLRRLQIRCYFIDEQFFDHLDALLSVLKNLQSFCISIERTEFNVEFLLDRFASLLTCSSPSLAHFRAKIPLNSLFSIDFLEIRRLHPLFVNVRYQNDFHRLWKSHLIVQSEC